MFQLEAPNGARNGVGKCRGMTQGPEVVGSPSKAIHGEFPAVRIIGPSVLDGTEQWAAMGEAGTVAYVRKNVRGGPDPR
jgi:hypothetical protein